MGSPMMKPILFNAEMVRAILDGRKTVTRRAVKCTHKSAAGFNIVRNHVGEIVGVLDYDEDERSFDNYTVPPYKPGDILWVRETFRIDYLSNIIGMGRVHYKADGSFADIRFAPNRYDMMRRAQLKPGWRPNENMPREAARIFLLVKNVQVERLQDMTEDDVVAEGAEPLIQCHNEHPVWDENGVMYGTCWNEDCCGSHCDYIEKSYGELFGELVWDSTIKPVDRDRYGWAANPWVWRVGFERCEKPECWYETDVS